MATSYSPKIVTDGLVLALDASNVRSYPGSGTTWKDLSGNGNDGTLTNGPTYSSANGGSLIFDGVDDRVTISGTDASLDITTQITMISWINPITLSATWQGVFLRQTVGVYELWVYGNKLRYGLNTGTGTIRASGNISLSTGKWYMLAWTYDGSIVRLYVNNVADSTFSRTGNISTSNGTVFIGYSGYSSEYFNGNITSCKLYNRALSAAEVAQNFNALRNRFGI